MKVLIYGKTIPQTVDCSIAFHGFEELEADITISQNWFLSKDELKAFDVCVGGVNASRHALFCLDVKDYELSCYPEKLIPLLKRNVFLTTLGEVIKGTFLKRQVQLYNKFVKSQKPKVFFPFKTDDKFFVERPEFQANLMGLADDIPVYVSDIVEFVSEWRVYVNNRQIENICHYTGSPLIFPSIMVIEGMIEAWTDSPCCYALDVGILKDNMLTALVEVNDFYAIGNYGLEPRTYAEMLLCRWTELTQSRRS
ncbi:MAG: ATP-grasp domain-containing protein [Candidatus Nanoarchaeia archaeon]|jgi:hypothetical protein|nr:ATP-grasp domain-containing protein [Candidatus Nanoarchaeia archaeon]